MLPPPHVRAPGGLTGPSGADKLGSPHFSDQDRARFYQLIQARRDMRHFTPGASVEPEVLMRMLQAAHHAPSVGLMQPWRFVRITDAGVRLRIAQLVEVERQRTCEALGERGSQFLQLKVEGIKECAELLVVVLAPDDGTVFGRRTMPQEMALCSVACAIQNLWLAARVENLGMGWVSMFDPAALSRVLQLPDTAQPVAILCLGPVPDFYDAPMLELEDWRYGRSLDELLLTNHWPAPSPRG
ncbi:MAG: 5,6-dimethylbenzimidazole synthase [Aquabacterium sp.]|uniref:5,6-dimethylbenzimidazole synthase n=1 Tax=Aquabacterium sp. TaxID=1872578 RepID=UPI002A3691BC|nr:5,6-dimethylbenzimidazole synthase [Aquabacterium sp.]MDX9842483.1 5,6-dimethylbenzimidazole synthase [Aquabacterium sp.]